MRSVTGSAYHDKSIANDIAMARRSSCSLHGNMVDYGQHTHVRLARYSVGNEHKGVHFRTWRGCVRLADAFVDAARHRT
jgi:hypothetical protein